MKDNHTEQIEEFSEAMRTACEKSLKTTKAPRKSQKKKISPLVDTRTYCNEENHKLFKEEIPENKKQQRTKREK